MRAVTLRSGKLKLWQPPSFTRVDSYGHNREDCCWERLNGLLIELIAEDGVTSMMETAFQHVVGGEWQGTIGRFDEMPNGPIICHGQSASMPFEVTVTKGRALYLSYASMVLPSNDAFVANGDPKAHVVFNRGGNFRFETIIDYGSDILDAGTEENDEIPENTPLLGGMVTVDGGTSTENGVVTLHEGFNARGTNGILDNFENADFTVDGYKAMKIEIELDDDSRRRLASMNSSIRGGGASD